MAQKFSTLLCILVMACFGIANSPADIPVLNKPSQVIVMLNIGVPSFEHSSRNIETALLPKYNGKIKSIFTGLPEFETDPRFARYFIVNAYCKDSDKKALLDELQNHKDVHAAYQPVDSIPAHFPARKLAFQKPGDLRRNLQKHQDTGARTPYFRPLQGYFDKAIYGGMDIDHAHANYNGSLGDDMQILFIDSGYNKAHEALRGNLVVVESNPTDSDLCTKYDCSHGTGTAGVLNAAFQDFGINGIVPNAMAVNIIKESFRFKPFENFDLTVALLEAFYRARPGDVVLIEFQMRTLKESIQMPVEWIPPAGDSNRPTTEILTPVEWMPLEADIIRRMTEAGIVVIEVGGNGGLNLDVPATKQRWTDTNKKIVDVGLIPSEPATDAIIVGASAGLGLCYAHNSSALGTRNSFSSYGDRIDVHAWGSDIVTTQYEHTCDLYGEGFGSNCYSACFGGTSGAAALIAGVVASVQGIIKQKNLRLLTSKDFRQLFRDVRTGVSQVDSAESPKTRKIGLMPDMSRLVPVAITKAGGPPAPAF